MQQPGCVVQMRSRGLHGLLRLQRPAIPRKVKADVVCCHGPFLQGDYKIADALRLQSSAVLELCDAPPPCSVPVKRAPSLADRVNSALHFGKDKTPASPFGNAPTETTPAQTRRLFVTIVGIKPHRKSWTQSARPGESVLHYLLLDSAPSLVVPAKTGVPAVSWCTLTLKDLHRLFGPTSATKRVGVVSALFEFLSMVVDFDRMIDTSSAKARASEEAPLHAREEAVRRAVVILIDAAVRSRESRAVKEQVDDDRAGIVFFRIP